MFSMFQMLFWYNKEHDDQNNVENVAIMYAIDKQKINFVMEKSQQFPQYQTQ